MSAFVVSDKHIEYIMAYAQSRSDELRWHGEQFDLRIPGNLDRWASCLMNTNIRSVNERYGDADPDRVLTLSPYALAQKRIEIPQLLKALDCYDYQACELTGYRESPAAKFVNYLRQQAITEIPGYKQAEWEIS